MSLLSPAIRLRSACYPHAFHIPTRLRSACDPLLSPYVNFPHTPCAPSRAHSARASIPLRGRFAGIKPLSIVRPQNHRRPSRTELHAQALLLVPALEVRKARAPVHTHERASRTSTGRIDLLIPACVLIFSSPCCARSRPDHRADREGESASALPCSPATSAALAPALTSDSRRPSAGLRSSHDLPRHHSGLPYARLSHCSATECTAPTSSLMSRWPARVLARALSPSSTLLEASTAREANAGEVATPGDAEDPSLLDRRPTRGVACRVGGDPSLDRSSTCFKSFAPIFPSDFFLVIRIPGGWFSRFFWRGSAMKNPGRRDE